MAAPEGQTSPAGWLFSLHNLRTLLWLWRALKERSMMAQTADPGLGWLPAEWVLPGIHSLLLLGNISVGHFT